MSAMMIVMLFRLTSLAVAIAAIAAPAIAVGQEQAPAARIDLYGDPLPKGAVARIGTERYRDIRLSPGSLTPDEKTLVCCGTDGAIHFLEAHTGKNLGRVEIAGRSAVSVAVSFDGSRFVVASDCDSRNASISVFDFEKRESSLEFELAAKRRCTSIDFSRDGQWIVAIERERIRGETCCFFRVYRANQGTLLHEMRLREPFAYNRAAEVLAWIDGEEDHLAHVWQIAEWRPAGRWKLYGHGDDEEVDCLTVSDDGKMLAVAWKPRPWGIPVTGVSSPDAPTRADYSIDVVDMPSRRRMCVLSGNGRAVGSLLFSNGGRYLAVAEEDYFGRVPLQTRVWNVSAPRDLAETWYSPLRTSAPAFFSTAANHLFSQTFNAIEVFDLQTRRPTIDSPAGSVGHICLSADGNAIATAAEDGTVRLWDCATGSERRKLVQGRLGLDSPLAFVDQGNLIATVGSWEHDKVDAAGFIGLIDCATGNIREVMPLAGAAPTAIAASSHGSTFAVASETPGPGGGCVIRALEPKPLRLRWEIAGPPNHSVESIRFSADGSMLAYAFRGRKSCEVYVVRADSGERLSRFSARGALSPIAFAPDSATLAVARSTSDATEAKCIALYDTRKWGVTRELGPINGTLHAATILPGRRSRLLAYTSSQNGALGASLWDCENGDLIEEKRVSNSRGQLRDVACSDRFVAVLRHAQSCALIYSTPFLGNRGEALRPK